MPGEYELKDWTGYIRVQADGIIFGVSGGEWQQPLADMLYEGAGTD